MSLGDSFIDAIKDLQSYVKVTVITKNSTKELENELNSYLSGKNEEDVQVLFSTAASSYGTVYYTVVCTHRWVA